MRKVYKIVFICLVSIIAMISGFVGVKEYCMDPELWNALGFDPNASSVSVSLEELEARTANAARTNPELFTDDYVKSVGGTPSGTTPSQSAPAQPSSPAPSQPSSKDSGKKDGKQAESVKITVTFTDMYGHSLGSSQVTTGTTIADSQFVKDVPDCNGKKFDRWDYDGGVIEHDFVVRGLYK